MKSEADNRGGNKLAQKSAATRARLIEATLDLLAQHGFRGVSLDMVAARVGMTKGAIYGAFPGGKDALLMAALGSRPEGRPDGLKWPVGRDGPVEDRLRRLAQAVLEARGSIEGAIANAEFLLYALTHDEMRQVIGQLSASGRKRMEENILSLFEPHELSMPVPAFALLMNNLIPSLTYANAFGGDDVAEETVISMFTGFASHSPRA